LLFIAEFDALGSMLWSNYDRVREAAQKELTAYIKKTMCSTFDLVDGDFIHENHHLPSAFLIKRKPHKTCDNQRTTNSHHGIL
jgi:hypothetical protein